MDHGLFPAFLKLSGRRVLVVGGGTVAASKIDALLRSGADITVVAPSVSPAIVESGVTVLRRRFRRTDLDGVWFVVSAATPLVNQFVARLAEPRCLYVNAVDDPANASAYLGGVVRRVNLRTCTRADRRVDRHAILPALGR